MRTVVRCSASVAVRLGVDPGWASHLTRSQGRCAGLSASQRDVCLNVWFGFSQVQKRWSSNTANLGGKRANGKVVTALDAPVLATDRNPSSSNPLLKQY